MPLAEETDGKRPKIDDHIYEIDNKAYTDKEFWVLEKVAILMCDHEIDLIDAEQHDKTIIEEAEIGDYLRDMMEDQVLRCPAYSGKSQQWIKETLPLQEESPDMELPGYQGPFYQRKNIDDDKIAPTVSLNDDKPDDFSEKADKQQ